MNQRIFLVNFENCSPGQARAATEDLEIVLSQVLPDATIIRDSSHLRAQSDSTILNIVLALLGAPAIVALSNTLSDSLKRRKDIGLTVRNAEKEIIFQNLTYKESEQILPLLARYVSLEIPNKGDEADNKGGEKGNHA